MGFKSKNNRFDGLSIIIPVYNDRLGLEKCLKSIRTLKSNIDYEIIVVDNNSDVPVNDIADKFSAIYVYEPKKGSYAARNSGIKRSTYSYVCFTDSDCLFDKNWFNEILRLIEYQGHFFFAGDVRIKISQQPNCWEKFEQYYSFDQKGNAEKGLSVTAHLLIEKKILEDFGGFDESYLSGGDFEFTSRVSDKYSLNFADELIVWHPARSTFKEFMKKDIRVVGGKYIMKLKNKRFMYRLIYPFGYSLKLLSQIPTKLKGKNHKSCIAFVLIIRTITKFIALQLINLRFLKPKRC